MSLADTSGMDVHLAFQYVSSSDVRPKVGTSFTDVALRLCLLDWCSSLGDAGAGIPMTFGGNNQAGEIHIATAFRTRADPHLDFESEAFLAQ